MSNLLFIVGIGGPEIMLLLFFIGIPTILWVWALMDLLSSDFVSSTNKLLWVAMILFLPILGAILYLLIGRKQKVRTLPR